MSQSPRRLRALAALSLGLWLGGLLPACERRRATRSDCEAIFDALVARELQERGFRDPALAERKAKALRVELGSEIARCVDLPLRATALTCVRRAASVEQISHRCLR